MTTSRPIARTFWKAAPYVALATAAVLLPTPAGRRGAPPRRIPPEPPPPPAGLDDGSKPERHTTDPAQVHDASRGRLAEAPQEIPRKGWKDILLRTKKEFVEDQIPLVAAGITFYSLLAMFPALASFAALYGLFADVAQVQDHLRTLSVVMPPEMLKFVGTEMVRISTAHEGGLSLAFAGGLLLSIWSANGATKAMITALNIAFEEQEKRGLVRRTLTSLAFTLGFLVFGLVAVATIAAPAAAAPFIGTAAANMLAWTIWPALLVAMGGALMLLYRYGPSRHRAKWRWLTWGSGAALALWVAASAAFSIYVGNFAHYEKTYGTLGALIGFMMWIYVSSQVILLGAELNSEIEHQTAEDTTTGPEKPLGARGAVMADTVGEQQGR